MLQLDDFEGPSPPDEAPGRSALRRWARFLGTNSEAELKRIAHEDPKMRRAIETIQTLSKDPKAQRLAQAREEAAFFYRADINAAKDEGKAEGKAELVAALLEARFGALDAATTERVLKASESELETWALRVLSASTLAEVFAD